MSHTELSESSQGTGAEERSTAQTFSQENCPFLWSQSCTVKGVILDTGDWQHSG